MIFPSGYITREAVSLKECTTFRIGGRADLEICPRNPGEANEILGILNREGIAWYPLGRGSNVIAADEGFKGVIVHFNRYMSQIRLERGLIISEAGASAALICEYMLLCGMSGGEFLSCIPASAGGAVINNSGCFGQDMSQIVEYVVAVNGEGLRVFTKEESAFSYRNSFFKRNREWIIVEVGFRFGDGNPFSRGLISNMKSKKQLTQPLELCSAGCIFKTAGEISAGRLIDEMGFKGLKSGGAEVSRRHANFIVNPDKNATSADVLRLIGIIADEARSRYGVALETEIDFLPR